MKNKQDHIIAVCCSDVHLSLRPPIARAEEPSWGDAQRRVWMEVSSLMESHQAICIIAGDLFDRWNAPAELINLAMDILPEKVYAIPGNHDLPNHREDLIHKSGFGTLWRAGRIVRLTKRPKYVEHTYGPLALYGRPFGGDTPRPSESGSGKQFYSRVLVTHEYVWRRGYGYFGVGQETHLSARAKDFSRFDTVIVGDNHMGFQGKLESGTRVFNCGTLMRRKSPEGKYKPRVGLLHASGAVTPWLLDTSRDVFHKTEVAEDEAEDVWDESVSRFVEKLGESGKDNTLDFREAIKRAIEKASTRKQVKEIIAEAMDE